MFKLRFLAANTWFVFLIGTSVATGKQAIGEYVEAHRPDQIHTMSVSIIDKGWAFEAQLLKPTAVPYEPVFLHLKLTNITDESRVSPILAHGFGDLHYEIVNEHGDHVSMMTITAHPSYHSLQPGESGEVKYFDIRGWATKVKGAPPGARLSTGKYSVTIRLSVDSLGNAPGDEYAITLPPLHFHILEPTGDSARAFELYSTGRGKRAEESLHYFYQILSDYQHTPYDALANKMLIMHRISGKTIDSSEALRLRKRYFLKYPDHHWNHENTNELIPRIPRVEMKELYRTIQDRKDAAFTTQFLREHHPWVFEKEEN